MAIRVAIVDDQSLVRVGLRALLERADDIVVAAEASDGDAAIDVITSQQPDIALVDIRMPGTDGIAVIRRIALDPRCITKLIALTTFDLDEYVFEAIRAGAAGFLLKDTEPDELRRAVRTVAAGRSLLDPAVTKRVMDAAAEASPTGSDAELIADLTQREREVLSQVGKGWSNDEIAADLVISPATARTYVSRLLAKLDARDRSQLVVIAHRSGLVKP